MTRDVDDHALNLAEGTAADATLDPELAVVVRDYRRLLGALSLARKDVPPLPDHLRHWAKVWVDSRLPEAESLMTRVLRVLATNAPAPAVRNGHAGGSAALYGDDHHHVDLRIEPIGDHCQRLRGQVLSLEDGRNDPWHVSLVTADGSVHLIDTNEAGEFSLEGVVVTAGTAFVAQRGDARLVVPRLEELEPFEA